MTRPLGPSGYTPMQKCACGQTARLGKDKCGACIDKEYYEQLRRVNHELAIRNVTDAIEAFTDAKIRRFDAMTAGQRVCIGTSYQIDVDETREHMRDKLRELLP